jgi:predicted acyl esterase
VDLPTFQVGGWYDIFAQGSLDNFTAMRRAGRSATLIMEPWSHANQQHVVGDVNFGFGANSAFMGMPGRLHDMQFDWYERTIGDGEALEPDPGEVLRDRPDPGGALRRHGRPLDRLGGPPV